jgi:hypothetical protein
VTSKAGRLIVTRRSGMVKFEERPIGPVGISTGLALRRPCTAAAGDDPGVGAGAAAIAVAMVMGSGADAAMIGWVIRRRNAGSSAVEITSTGRSPISQRISSRTRTPTSQGCRRVMSPRVSAAVSVGITLPFHASITVSHSFLAVTDVWASHCFLSSHFRSPQNDHHTQTDRHTQTDHHTRRRL